MQVCRIGSQCKTPPSCQGLSERHLKHIFDNSVPKLFLPNDNCFLVLEFLVVSFLESIEVVYLKHCSWAFHVSSCVLISHACPGILEYKNHLEGENLSGFLP